MSNLYFYSFISIHNLNKIGLFKLFLLLLSVLVLFVGCNKIEKKEIEREEAMFTTLVIEMGHTSQENRIIVKVDIKSHVTGLPIWTSKDGTECSVDSISDPEFPLEPIFNCRTPDGWKSSTAFKCSQANSKENASYFFIGGVNKYNQNFEFWCE